MTLNELAQQINDNAPDMTSFEKSAIRMCASELERLLDQIESDVKGGER